MQVTGFAPSVVQNEPEEVRENIEDDYIFLEENFQCDGAEDQLKSIGV